MRIRPTDRTKWRRWFAWHPVIVDNVTVWLEVVERRRHPDIFDWVYGYRVIDRNDRRKQARARYARLVRWLIDSWWSLTSRRTGPRPIRLSLRKRFLR
jgi:hypothetical protein